MSGASPQSLSSDLRQDTLGPARVPDLLVGEMAMTLLTWQRVSPKVAKRLGYARRRQPELPAVLDMCVGP